MRKIPALPILIGSLFLTSSVGIAYAAAVALESVPVGVLVFVIITLLLYRMIDLISPLSPNHAEGYTEKDYMLPYDINMFYDLIFFSVMARSGLIPNPLTPTFYRLLGTKIGTNSFPSGGILGSPYNFISIGDNVIFGSGSVITAHIYESGGKLTIKPIRIGSNVTIGMNAVIMAGVTIGDNAIVAAGAIVTKDTHIGPGEIWGGVPARKIRDAVQESGNTTTV